MWVLHRIYSTASTELSCRAPKLALFSLTAPNTCETGVQLVNIYLSLSKYISKDITIHNSKIRNGFRIKGLFRNGGRIAVGAGAQSLAWENVEEAGLQTFCIFNWLSCLALSWCNFGFDFRMR